ncbi:MAG: thiamine diphosphokinase [Syntrophobacterales bacterium]|nr:thiamine diphosphokinase [Syntrophobacterales bacterium]
MGKQIFIISNGIINDSEFIRRRLKEANSPIIICADGAARHLRPLNVIPAFIIGDMDSIDNETVRYFDKKGSTILTYPGDKDETDTQLAIEYALKLQPDEIFIFGALGGRIDHTLANISLLIMGVKQGIDIKIIDETCEIFIVNQQSIVEGEAGKTVSLLPLSSEVAGVTLEGFEYPLSGGVMEIGRPYGISNRLIAEKGIITVKSGYLLVIRNFKV